MQEKRLLLIVFRDGDPTLYARAAEIVDAWSVSQEA